MTMCQLAIKMHLKILISSQILLSREALWRFLFRIGILIAEQLAWTLTEFSHHSIKKKLISWYSNMLHRKEFLLLASNLNFSLVTSEIMFFWLKNIKNWLSDTLLSLPLNTCSIETFEIFSLCSQNKQVTEWASKAMQWTNASALCHFLIDQLSVWHYWRVRVEHIYKCKLYLWWQLFPAIWHPLFLFLFGPLRLCFGSRDCVGTDAYIICLAFYYVSPWLWCIVGPSRYSNTAMGMNEFILISIILPSSAPWQKTPTSHLNMQL